MLKTNLPFYMRSLTFVLFGVKVKVFKKYIVIILNDHKIFEISDH